MRRLAVALVLVLLAVPVVAGGDTYEYYDCGFAAPGAVTGVRIQDEWGGDYFAGTITVVYPGLTNGTIEMVDLRDSVGTDGASNAVVKHTVQYRLLAAMSYGNEFVGVDSVTFYNAGAETLWWSAKGDWRDYRDLYGK